MSLFCCGKWWVLNDNYNSLRKFILEFISPKNSLGTIWAPQIKEIECSLRSTMHRLLALIIRSSQTPGNPLRSRHFWDLLHNHPVSFLSGLICSLGFCRQNCWHTKLQYIMIDNSELHTYNLSSLNLLCHGFLLIRTPSTPSGIEGVLIWYLVSGMRKRIQ